MRKELERPRFKRKLNWSNKVKTPAESWLVFLLYLVDSINSSKLTPDNTVDLSKAQDFAFSYSHILL